MGKSWNHTEVDGVEYVTIPKEVFDHMTGQIKSMGDYTLKLAKNVVTEFQKTEEASP